MNNNYNFIIEAMEEKTLVGYLFVSGEPAPVFDSAKQKITREEFEAIKRENDFITGYMYIIEGGRK